MKKILKAMKRNWTRVWLIIAIIASVGAFVAYSAYTEVSTVKRVVSTTADPGELFSSNCMRQNISSRILSSPQYTVTVCNFDQEKLTSYNPSEVTYTLYAELQVKYEGEYKNMVELRSAIDAKYAVEETATQEEKDAAQAAADAEYNTYIKTTIDAYSIRKTENDTAGSFDNSEKKFSDYSSSGYKVSFPSDTLAPTVSSTDRYLVTVSSGDTSKTDPDYYVHVWAIPTGTLHRIDSRLYGSASSGTSASWTGTLLETDCETKDYDFYNYIISGSGIGTIDIKWDPSKFEINEFFFSSLSGNSFVGGSTPVSITNPNDPDPDNPTLPSWSKISISVGINNINRYELQLYKVLTNTQYTGATNKASNFITCEFIPSNP